jgi:hypothetical protein
MWSDSLFSIPEYINEFELRHFCFGEGDSSGSGQDDESLTPDEMYGTPEQPTAPDANNPNSPNAGYVGGEMPSPMSVDYGREFTSDYLNPSPSLRGVQQGEFDNTRISDDPSYAQQVGAFLANLAFTGLTGGLNIPIAGTVNTVLGLAGQPNVGSVAAGIENPQSIAEQVSSFADNFTTDEPEAIASEARSEIALPTDGIGFLGQDMPEGPSELIPVAPVSAMQRVPTIQQQQIAEALLQPQQGRAGYTRAGVLGPIYNV